MTTLDFSRRALLATLPVALAGCASAGAPTSGLRSGALDGFPQAPAGPPLPTGPLARIAVTSCAREDRELPLYAQLARARPDLALLIGDNVYGSAAPEDPQLSDLRAAYFQMARRQEFQELARTVPIVAVWDDHDFGKNDAGTDFPHKDLAQAMFNRFWNIPGESPLRSRPGIYRSMVIGPPGQRVQIIVLDTRYFRDPLIETDQRGVPGRERYVPHPAGSTADILGPAQWTWLEQQLRVPAEIRIVASSIQVVADGHGWERWGNFPAARDRLYRLIGSTAARGVVFVSGDRHLAAINRISDVAPYPLFDLTGSAINASSWMPGSPTDHTEAGPNRIGPSYTPPNYGMVEVDWPGRSLSLAVIGEGGVRALSQTVSFASLMVA